MKRALILAVVTFASAFIFIACDKSEKAPNSTLDKNFSSMFPNAKHIEWEMEHGYYVAEFRDNGYDKEIWFDNSYSWVLTKTEYERKVPDAVKNAVNLTNYKDWRIDDADFIEMKDRNSFYIVEVEKGEAETDLYFSESGEFLKEVSEDGDYHRELY